MLSSLLDPGKTIQPRENICVRLESYTYRWYVSQGHQRPELSQYPPLHSLFAIKKKKKKNVSQTQMPIVAQIRDLNLEKSPPPTDRGRSIDRESNSVKAPIHVLMTDDLTSCDYHPVSDPDLVHPTMSPNS